MIGWMRFEGEVVAFGRLFERFSNEQKVKALRFLLSLMDESIEKEDKEGDDNMKKEEKEKESSKEIPVVIGVCNELGKNEWANLSRTNSGGSSYDVEKFRGKVVERAKKILRDDLQEMGLKENEDYIIEEVSADETPVYRTVWVKKFSSDKVQGFTFDDINFLIRASEWWWRRCAADFLMGKF